MKNSLQRCRFLTAVPSAIKFPEMKEVCVFSRLSLFVPPSLSPSLALFLILLPAALLHFTLAFLLFSTSIKVAGYVSQVTDKAFSQIEEYPIFLKLWELFFFYY